MNLRPGLTAACAALSLAACASSPTNASIGPDAGTDIQPPTACAPASEQQVAALFDRWNASLATGDPAQVVKNYAEDSILLPTVSNTPRLTPEAKADYFREFLKNQPSGRIDQRYVKIGCNTELDAGLYTFTFAKTGAVVHARYSYTYEYKDGQWLITSHHSSAMPEK